NSLFCQCAVQKVEPILSPEELARVNVGGRTENATVDRFLRQRRIAHRDVRGLGACREGCRVASTSRTDRLQNRGIVNVALLCPQRTAERQRQIECSVGTPL